MKMVVLDGAALNPGDLDWAGLERYGQLTVYDRTAPVDVGERAKDADVVFTNKVAIDAQTLDALPQLKYIGVLATGYNMVDIARARERGVVVTNIPGYSSHSVVQLTFALLLELCHRVQRHSDSVFDGKWSRSLDFSFWDYPLIELAGKNLGIIGFGDIGQRVADVGAALGMQVIGYSRTQTDQSHRPYFRWASLDNLLEEADVVTIHSPLTPQTQCLINADALAKMKPTAFLLNTARGPIIEETDLAKALNEGKIAGAGLDVLSVEPPPLDNPLLSAKNCLITPHIAWATKEARSRLMGITIDNLQAYVDGVPTNVVNA